ncbi:L,D-transpeptidase family protein [uncultured Thiohalocapsa sp.]|uniref:L,D-transpeptidase family protein n=1 Tax=uncultured Thiohalocapsa sp. TaxID=768990 RepID=UPI0025D33C66|nr:L,D-transpeptidase family protein [uncultured Thiohalocapsa sp.]
MQTTLFSCPHATIGAGAGAASPGSALGRPHGDGLRRALYGIRRCGLRAGLLWAALLLAGCAGLPEIGLFMQPAQRTDRFVLPDPDTDVVGQVQYVVARDEDTLPDFARRYGLGYDEIVAANPDVDPWLPGAGTRVVLPTRFVLPDAPREGIVLNLPALRLFYYPPVEEGEPRVVVTHPVGIGREGWRTPVGRMRIIQKTENPAWRPPASIRREHAKRGDPLPAVVPAGPDNPLGSHAMRLSRPSYLLHGTNKPYGVGMRVSHGCVRLYPEDISRLFAEVPVGTDVHIVNQPYLAGWQDGVLHLEAHAPLAEDAKRWQGSLAPMEKVLRSASTDAPDAVDWEQAQTVARAARGLPVPVGAGSPDPDQVIAAARRAPRVPPWAEPLPQPD